jgi:class 3 adenylate cyclase
MVHRLRTLLSFVLAPRRSPDMRVRTAWWIGLFVLLGLCWSQPPISMAVSIMWLIVNVLYLAGAVGWSCFHPRSLLGVREISLRWSVLLTLLAALILFSQLYGALDQLRPTTEGPNHLAAVILVVTVLVCPLLFVLILGLGLLGATVGAFAMRRSPNIKQSARSAVVFWFIASMVLALWATVSQHHSDLRQLYSYSIPLLTVAFCRLADGPEAPLARSGHSLVQRVEAVLILRRLRRGRWNTLDLRGAALGLLSALLMLSAPLALITPLKTMALATLIQVRSASVESLHFDFDASSSLIQLEHRDDIVLLNLDDATRYRILHGSSEAAIQAAVIRKLSGWGVREIVLPSPLVHSARYEPVTNQPSPDEPAVHRCRRDMHLLSEAVQRPNAMVITTLPPMHHRFTQTGSDYDAMGDPLLQPLYNASATIAAGELPLSDRVRLPIIPSHVSGPHARTALPILIALDRNSIDHNKITRDKTNHDQPEIRRHTDIYSDVALSSVLGSHMPLISTDGVLVNFFGKGPQYDFLHIDYATLLHDEMIHANGPGMADGLGRSQWEDSHTFFHRGQVVLLDSVQHPLAMTPLGIMSQPEVLAYATSTLLARTFISPVTPASLIVMTLLMGLAIGGACFRRDPLDAIWRAAIPMFLVALTSLSMFEFVGIWLDPILPLGTAIIALTMVTQLSFAQERSDRRRTRALFQRFVASDQLDNWLAMPEDALALGGKRQTVCVLFADVRNFTHFAEQNEADKVIEVINAYMSGLTDALHRFGGVLDKYTGDGLMAWFPIKEDARKDLKNSVDAALAMRDAALTISTQMPPAEQLDIGIGLHFGDAVVGLVGNEKLQINWTALGHTVVVSARLQTIASGGEVVISESLYEAIAGAFAVVEGVPVMVKGLSIPVRPYRVIGSAPNDDGALVAVPPARVLSAPPPDQCE